MLLGWGMRDPTFGEEHVARWRAVLPDTQFVTFADAGHVVQEEAPDALAAAVRDVLGRTPDPVAGR